MLKLSAPPEHLNLHLREGSILPTQVSSHPPPPRAGDCPRGDTSCMARAPQYLKLQSPCRSQPSPPYFGLSKPYSAHVFEPQKPGPTSEASRGNPLRLIVALSPGATAWGDLFWDDGESLDTFERGSYSYLVFNATEVGHGGDGAWGPHNVPHLATSCSCCPLLQNIFTSRVLHTSTEATSTTIGTLSIYGVREPPHKVLLNGQEKPFSYLDNQVRPHLGCPVLEGCPQPWQGAEGAAQGGFLGWCGQLCLVAIPGCPLLSCRSSR